MSIEAFAMAGVDCKECAINHCTLEQINFKHMPPEVDKGHTTDLSLDLGMEWVKMKMREWATAVASNNETKANLRVSEIVLIMENHIMR
ncbi:hypothetical protein SESBI_44660 [Sesbania bispinosa]|nr:hypothetical protein SESBI_44660 [Sesbania bispinosa]